MTSHGSDSSSRMGLLPHTFDCVGIGFPRVPSSHAGTMPGVGGEHGHSMEETLYPERSQP
jgi:hypothetical protein